MEIAERVMSREIELSSRGTSASSTYRSHTTDTPSRADVRRLKGELMTPMPPFSNPRYRIERLLGSGGFGEVYLAEDCFMGSSVAIKILRDRSFDAGDRFRRELRILRSQLNNRHVATVLDADLEALPPYIVLEYCARGSLRQWVDQRRPWRDVAVALAHAMFGLRDVHALGGFHRDLKPDNLLLAEDDAAGELIVKVADFGLARVPSTSSDLMTNDARGTFGYTAPEVLLGHPFTAASDVYALGITAVELITGARDPAVALPGIPESFAKLIRAMTVPTASQRPTLDELARKFNALLQPTVPPATASHDKPSAASGGGWLVLLGLGAAALAAWTRGNEKDWDASVGRYRGLDGRFAKS